MNKSFTAIVFILLSITTCRISASELVPPPDGDVRVPLATYQQMLEQLREVSKAAPSDFAIGHAEMTVNITEREGDVTATVHLRTTLKTFEDQWSLIPILPHGAALSQVYIDDQPVQLVQGPLGFNWTTQRAGVYDLSLSYHVDATRSESGYVLAVPTPAAVSSKLTVHITGTGLDLAVIPATDVRHQSQDEQSVITANIPMTNSVLISWRAFGKQSHVMSRAHYQGHLVENAIAWEADFGVEVFSSETIHLPLMPTTVTLSEVSLDNQPATVLEEAGHFVIMLSGRGSHQVKVKFLVPVEQQQGPPVANLKIPAVPISRFDLTLPGNKEVSVLPKSNVTSDMDTEKTIATVFLPMSQQASFSWVDAVPAELKAKVRANANIYHRVHAEEGVLHVLASLVYEISHGETSKLSFLIPKQTQVNRILASSGGISDWTVEKAKKAGYKQVTVFLNRPVKGDYALDVYYERLINNQSKDSIEIPLLTAQDIHRQRGMVALLAGQELALKPIIEEHVNKVGENQLPASIKNNINMSIAHTYKYTEDNARLIVKAVAPERKQGQFDAQVDTLISLGEVTLKGSASIQIDVKSGAIMDLQMMLPNDINILSISGPSIRSKNINNEGTQQVIDIVFTQEMAGQFRLGINYERILNNMSTDLVVPSVSVRDAEVEHGRIAVEALTALEVKVGQAKQLSTIDINELPQMLVLKTSNPILLAFKYVQSKPPPSLTLTTTRHQEIAVQEATIEQAHYQTLITDDGLAVTTAKLQVRNSRRQFLRLTLPAHSEVWSVFVNGRTEKPANAEGQDAILIRMVNSVLGFPVEIVYATPIDKMEFYGSISSHLPQPDMIVTRSLWDVFLPASNHYHQVNSNMTLTIEDDPVNPQQLSVQDERTLDSTDARKQPLRVVVPTAGIHYQFEKLYANRAEDVAQFRIAYSSPASSQMGLLLSLLSMLLIYVGLYFIGVRRNEKSQLYTLLTLVPGGLLLLMSITVLNANIVPPAALAALGGVAYFAFIAFARIQRWRAGH